MVDLIYKKEIPEAIREKYLSPNHAQAPAAREASEDETSAAAVPDPKLTPLQSELPDPDHNRHTPLSTPPPDSDR